MLTGEGRGASLIRTAWCRVGPKDPSGISCLLNFVLKNRPKGEACRPCHVNELTWPYCSSRECWIMWF